MPLSTLQLTATLHSKAASLQRQSCFNGRPLFQAFTSQAAPCPRAWRVCVAAGKGFDKQSPATKAPPKQKKPKLERYLDLEEAKGAAAGGDGWTRVASYSQDFLSKPLKAVILQTGQAIVVYKVNDKVYCSDANSTAYQYPLVDASILQTKTGPAVEVPLDGTTYDLATGKVLSWCPKNTLTRKVLGVLKDRSEPQDLKVYTTEVRGDDIFVRFI